MDADPYRQVPYKCPVCPATGLREYQTRLCCDACQGIQLSLDELSRAIEDLTGMTPAYEYVDEKPGDRRCPRCSGGLTRCRVRLTLDEHRIKTKTELDRCAAHGLWFDGEELADVLAKVRSGVTPRRGGGMTGGSRSGPPRGLTIGGGARWWGK